MNKPQIVLMTYLSVSHMFHFFDKRHLTTFGEVSVGVLSHLPQPSPDWNTWTLKTNENSRFHAVKLASALSFKSHMESECLCCRWSVLPSFQDAHALSYYDMMVDQGTIYLFLSFQTQQLQFALGKSPAVFCSTVPPPSGNMPILHPHDKHLHAADFCKEWMDGWIYFKFNQLSLL